MTFKTAVEATPEIQNAWKRGLRALRAADSQRIDAEVTRRLSGSVDLDTTLSESCPNDPRWDYAVGYRSNGGGGETVYWIEIHPASSGDVNTVLRKLEWLKKWLADKAPKLNEMRKDFLWISSGRTSFTLSSPQAKRFALLGLRHTGQRFKIGSAMMV